MKEPCMGSEPKVLVVTTSRRTRGGISSVVKGYQRQDLWHRFSCRWIETQIDRGVVLKLIYLVRAWFQYVYWLNRYDIVHFHTVPGNSTRIHLPMLLLAKRRGRKVIVHVHVGEQLEAYVGDGQLLSLLSRADWVVVLSEKARMIVCEQMGITTPVEIIYNAVEVDGRREVEHVRKPMVLVAGVLDTNKAWDIIIKAFARVAPRFAGWKLVFAGYGEIEAAQALAREEGIAAQVEFPGWVSGAERERLFADASVYCLASYREGFPMSVLEAWARGIPVVCTAAGGLADVVEDGVNALVMAVGDSGDLARQLERLMSDEDLRLRLAARAEALVQEKFLPDVINKQVEKLYLGLR